MKQTAQGLAALGRGPDTQLVHMAPSEVAGLQALAQHHGGSLTINPDTGLPEAGFLSSILPMVIGAGLVAATGGTALALTPMMAAGVTAAGYTIATGSLQKGLMAGLGAYGGAGLAGGLMGAGALEAGAAGTLEAGAGVASENAATQAALQQNALTNIGIPSNAAAGTGSMSFAPNAGVDVLGQSAGLSGPMSVPTTTGQLMGGVPQVATATPIPTAPTFSDNFAQIGRGAEAVTASPGAAFDFAKDNYKPIGAAGISLLAGMQPDELNAPAPKPGMIRPYTFSREKIPGSFVDVPGEQRSSKERNYFRDVYTPGTPYKAPGAEYLAEGGSVGGYSYDPATGQYSGGQASSPSMGGAPVSDYASGNIGGYTYDPITQQYTLSNVTPEGQARRDIAAAPPVSDDPFNHGGGMANGGISNLGSYSDGGRLLRGPGDGVSDSIPAMIGQKQKARLADGEFVVPARIVSELGNGSTEAGARQLYSMMDRVQKNRQKSMGKGKVATDAKSHKLLPA